MHLHPSFIVVIVLTNKQTLLKTSNVLATLQRRVKNAPCSHGAN